jgi:DNA-binding NarL/FixJ family response regulator
MRLPQRYCTEINKIDNGFGSMSQPLRVVVADDSSAFRSSLCQFLNTLKTVTIVGEAADGIQALDLVEKLAPDVLLLDLSMPKMDGYEVLQRLRVSASPVQVVILTGHADVYFDQLLREGAVTCLEKSKGPVAIGQTFAQLAKANPKF